MQSSFATWHIALLAVSGLFAMAGSIHAQGVSPFDRGTQAFRTILHRLGMKPVADVETALAEPPSTLIMILGDTTVFDDQFVNGGLRQFVADGGAVLVASDQTSSIVLFNELSVLIDGQKVRGPDNAPDMVYRRDHLECPLAQPSTRPDVRSNLHLLGALRKVATNRPSFLRQPLEGENRYGPHRVFTELPPGCTIITPRFRNEFVNKRLMLGLAGSIERGRYAVLADHSIFLNSLLLQPDNDNIAFTVKLTNWLTEDGKRTRVLFADDGAVRTDFDLNLDYLDPPLPHPDVLGPAADRLMMGLESHDFFNRVIRQSAPVYRLLRYLLFGVSLLTGAYLMYRITAGRYRPEPGAVRLPDRLADAPLEADAGLGLAESGRELARAALARWYDEPRPARPAVIAADGRTQRTWARRVRNLFDVADGRGAVSSRADLKRLAAELAEFEDAVCDGTIRLGTGDHA
jgi:hypothetical protein